MDGRSIFIPLKLEEVTTGKKLSLRKPMLSGNRYSVKITNRVQSPGSVSNAGALGSLRCVLNITDSNGESILPSGITTTDVPQDTEMSLGEFDVTAAETYLLKLVVAAIPTTTGTPVYSVERLLTVNA